jgi:hypothetical protein
LQLLWSCWYDAAEDKTMIELTKEQQALAQTGEQPPCVCDPETGTTYVLLRADIYERFRAMIESATRRAGWDDPALDTYERYRKAL